MCQVDRTNQTLMSVREQQSLQRMLFGSYTRGFGDVPPTETKKDPPSRRLDCLSPLFLRRLERTGRGQSQIHSVLENIQSNSLCEERALSWGESFEELG